jgi:hypothetical protein
MARKLPRSLDQWLKEILLAVEDAREAKPFAPLTGTELSESDLFHLAPLVCLKFRGKKWHGREAERVTKVALANYVANIDREGVDTDLKNRPLMAFALCYIAAHLALGLVDESTAEEIMDYCDEYLRLTQLDSLD